MRDRQVDDRGNANLAPKHPSHTPPPPTDDMLKEVLGALEAWKGPSALPLKACVMRGPKVVVAPHRVFEFHGAPNEVALELESLQKKHTEEFEALLFLTARTLMKQQASARDLK